ncbi:MAG: hypothetical protein BWY66_00545 [bacterium ADurb.Bin374]|nr:MAG: hypothetical protein BWY66_00545 [bacterium ADurb.Bin374]
MNENVLDLSWAVEMCSMRSTLTPKGMGGMTPH